MTIFLGSIVASEGSAQADLIQAYHDPDLTDSLGTARVDEKGRFQIETAEDVGAFWLWCWVVTAGASAVATRTHPATA